MKLQDFGRHIGLQVFVIAVMLWAFSSEALAQLDDAASSGFYQVFHQPETRYSRNGELTTQLTVDFSHIQLRFPESLNWVRDPTTNQPIIGANGRVELVRFNQRIPSNFFTRVYENMLPGPTLRLRPGDDLKMLLVNQLYIPEDYKKALTEQFMVVNNINELTRDVEGKIEKIFLASTNAGFNRTNIHTHGLHVSPKAVVNSMGNLLVSRDDVLVSVLPPGDPLAKDLGFTKPGQSMGRVINERLPYNIEIPVYHAPGTHWYHAHKDLAVSIQVQNGMSGALIIDEPKGQEILVSNKVVPTDKVLVLQEINNVLAEEGGGGKNTRLIDAGGVGGGVTGKKPLVRTINGLYQPTLHMRPQEIQRWRIVNAGTNTAAFNVISINDSKGNKQEFTLVARDGVNLYKPMPMKEVFVAAGNRIDILFQGPSTGEPDAYHAPTDYDIVVNDVPIASSDNPPQKSNGYFPGTNGTYFVNPFPKVPTKADNPGLPQFDSSLTYKGYDVPKINGTRPVYVLYIGPTVGYIYKSARPQPQATIGHVEVAGLPDKIDGRKPTMPTTLPKHTFAHAGRKPQPINYLKPIQENEITGRKTLVFDVTFPLQEKGVDGGDGYSVTKGDTFRKVSIDGEEFDADVVQVQVGDPKARPPYLDPLPIEHQGKSYAVEEWTILNNSDQTHPFHIHVNPFQVIEIGQFVKVIDAAQPKQQQAYEDCQGKRQILTHGDTQYEYNICRFKPEEARWQDTLALPPRGWIKIRSRFNDFMGEYVLHCHILNHEDEGMMLTVNVANQQNPVKQ